jgi:hypothetical protein
MYLSKNPEEHQSDPRHREVFYTFISEKGDLKKKGEEDFPRKIR